VFYSLTTALFLIFFAQNALIQVFLEIYLILEEILVWLNFHLINILVIIDLRKKFVFRHMWIKTVWFFIFVALIRWIFDLLIIWCIILFTSNFLKIQFSLLLRLSFFHILTRNNLKFCILLFIHEIVCLNIGLARIFNALVVLNVFWIWVNLRLRYISCREHFWSQIFLNRILLQIIFLSHIVLVELLIAIKTFLIFSIVSCFNLRLLWIHHKVWFLRLNFRLIFIKIF
jgi:hypothetical protein